MNSVTVRVPATTANLACGFDTVGCALSLYNTLSFTLSDTLSFTGCDEEFQTPDNLAFRGFDAVYAHLGRPAPAVRIDISSYIPVCRGLGSSAAMLAAGAAAANALSGAGLSKADLLSIVTPIEGHPDNLAPAFFGGLVASSLCDGRVWSASYPVHASLRFVVLSPDYTLSTHAARAALPASVPFADAVYDLSRLALLPRAFESGDEEMLALCLSDRLHQPYRRSLIPGFDEVRSLASALGCGAFCISGAGPSLLCVSRDPELAHDLSSAVSALPNSWHVRDLRVDPGGAMLL